jgi:hypothetical protein
MKKVTKAVFGRGRELLAAMVLALAALGLACAENRLCHGEKR